MSFDAKILADSIGPTGARLTTFEVTYPRIILAEVNTHRLLSRNSASSRAIPSEKLIKRVQDDPFLPVRWGKNQAGMQAREELSNEAPRMPDGGRVAVSAREAAELEWRHARNQAVASAINLAAIGLHKQIANRLVEPWMWVTSIISATEWENFFGLRCHPDAQPEFKKTAEMMREVYRASVPTEMQAGSWHRPLIFEEDLDEALARRTGGPGAALEMLRKVSVGRCARVSYLTHDGKRDLQADIDLCDRLASSGHWSPFEHVAMAMDEWAVFARFASRRVSMLVGCVAKAQAADLVDHVQVSEAQVPDKIEKVWTAPMPYGNFTGWLQYRKTFENEHLGGRRP